MDSSDIVKTLNKLIETCKDGEFGFASGAEHARGADLQQVFARRSQECRRAASELAVLVAEYGGSPEDGGTAGGALSRGWTAVKGSVGGYSDLTLLEACERGEDTALASYRKALEESDLPLAVRMTLETQMDGVRRNHDQIRVLRDRARLQEA
jgi:uncharacterized protein (TIGR02284 family)